MPKVSGLTRRGLLYAGAVAPVLTSSLLSASGPSSGSGFNASRVPFSRSGSYWAVSKRWDFGSTKEIPAGAWYIRLLEDDVSPNELFRLEILIHELALPFQGTLTPAKLTLAASSESAIDFVIPEPDVLRLRGRNCSLRLFGIKGSYGYAIAHPDGSWEVMADVAMPRVQIRISSGSLKVNAPWADKLQAAFCSFITVDLIPGDSGEFDCTLQYYDATPRSSQKQHAFDDCVKTVQDEFGSWLDRLPKLRSEYQSSRELAAYVLWSATVGPRGLYKTPVVWCSKNWMNRIWSWDHCFVAIGLAPSHPSLAWQQFMLVRDMQDAGSGMFCDWYSNVRRSWLCTKPPIHGWALSHLMRTIPLTYQELSESYEMLTKWTNFWLNNRNLDGDGLPCILNANESFDNTTSNTLFGPVKAPEIAAYLVLQMETLSRVAEKLGMEDAAKSWRRKSMALLETMIRLLWDPQARKFAARRVGDGKSGEGDCVYSYIPLLLGKRLPANIIGALVDSVSDPSRFFTPFGMSTESLKSARYDGNTYVKGPVWAPPTVFIAEGLEQVGAQNLASRLRKGFLDNCVRQGMSEHFDAHTGAAQGDPAYNWTAAMFLHFAQLQHNV